MLESKVARRWAKRFANNGVNKGECEIWERCVWGKERTSGRRRRSEELMAGEVGTGSRAGWVCNLGR